MMKVNLLKYSNIVAAIAVLVHPGVRCTEKQQMSVPLPYYGSNISSKNNLVNFKPILYRYILVRVKIAFYHLHSSTAELFTRNDETSEFTEKRQRRKSTTIREAKLNLSGNIRKSIQFTYHTYFLFKLHYNVTIKSAFLLQDYCY